MDARFGTIWQQIGAFKTPTYVKPLQHLLFDARMRRGGLLGSRTGIFPSALQRREELMATEDENIDKEDGDSDTSVDSTLGALLGDIL
jgi:hypothetical protein